MTTSKLVALAEMATHALSHLAHMYESSAAPDHIGGGWRKGQPLVAAAYADDEGAYCVMLCGDEGASPRWETT